jgi:hypothetical protein
MFTRYAKNASTLLSWSLRRDAFKPTQCFVDKHHTIPKFPEGACDCVKYCKHSPRPSGEMSYATYQVIENTIYAVTPIKSPIPNTKTVVMYL